MTQTFHIGAILSAITGKLLGDIGDVEKLMSFMIGEPVWTHSIPRVGDQCKPYLIEQFPELNVSGEEINPSNWEMWLASAVEQFGATREVYPIHTDDLVHVDPFKELEDMVGSDRIFKVDLDDPDALDNLINSL